MLIDARRRWGVSVQTSSDYGINGIDGTDSVRYGYLGMNRMIQGSNHIHSFTITPN